MRRPRVLPALLLAASLLAAAAPAHAAPANDALANAVTVTKLPYRNVRSTVGATRETGERSICITAQATVWYEIKLPATTEVAITTSGSNYDTVLTLYRASSRTHAALTFIDCVNDLGTQGKAALGFTANANTRYFLQVGSASGIAGRLELRITTGRQVHVPETRIGGATSVQARVLVAHDTSETEVIGRERLSVCYVGICFPFADVGHETTNVPAPTSRVCATVFFFLGHCHGPEQT